MSQKPLNRRWTIIGLVLSLILAMLSLLTFLYEVQGHRSPLLIPTLMFALFSFILWRRLQQT